MPGKSGIQALDSSLRWNDRGGNDKLLSFLPMMFDIKGGGRSYLMAGVDDIYLAIIQKKNLNR
ncbi:MAG: hypothetical protein A2509_06405 [Candidatus Edwardsbacteria bacterium RIFOXYD12_FULL_50_11]|uniref:Uncharacterized protein n=1 Tax=Candidatus Edwardsbacteria bacterium GWF2_54_11 TaxID=1817851 RepID=A0A1F5R369_9BACT|nr:MAG: hypothetical protein A2502_10210 [Candidatus Edwardsbacteria bacterium RifOxyC12_full_54_24]OGF06789.1 MAG: hypothetical protein A2273_00850 [Candidatus Edwardsbacteria bacterium RifOxyA12_full_54_48]OGF08856.1 MAG: hypothetical protein A2024_01110 [Candidatus Edwardsbacteria bacterium GWF2_54_11]OGF10739.1 MAG: hypothetical protein A3K15_06215 [Candidatus Edwardsbacteria bacterium GWE2_54_12]OGF15519.1 MAG: hypothetical protein A2509_06405 [Candidatus Edwardsbacteria bacterium RIFOXYD1